MELFVTLLIIIGALVLIIIILPQLISKETCTYTEAIEKFAKGKFVTVDGKKVHYVEAGNGSPIILIHGFLYHTVMWKKNIDALAEKFKVYAIDLWGWGYSERLKEKEYSFERYGKQIVGFIYGCPKYQKGHSCRAIHGWRDFGLCGCTLSREG
jgi:hypothetical protein